MKVRLTRGRYAGQIATVTGVRHIGEPPLSIYTLELDPYVSTHALFAVEDDFTRTLETNGDPC